MTRVQVFEPLELLRARYTRQRFAPHAHDEFVFGVVETGAARTYFRGAEDVHAAGSVITFGPGEVHTGAPATDEGWSYRMLYPTASLVRFVAREATGREFTPTFDASFVYEPLLADRVRATHAVLEGDADRLAERVRAARDVRRDRHPSRLDGASRRRLNAIASIDRRAPAGSRRARGRIRAHGYHPRARR